MARTRSKLPKLKKGAWFVPVRGSYLPVTLPGALTYIPFIAYLVLTLVIGWQEAGSHGLAVLFIVPNWIAATAVMTWLAARKS